MTNRSCSLLRRESSRLDWSRGSLALQGHQHLERAHILSGHGQYEIRARTGHDRLGLAVDVDYTKQHITHHQRDVPFGAHADNG